MLCCIWIKPVNPDKSSQYNELRSKDENPEKGDPDAMSTGPRIPGSGMDQVASVPAVGEVCDKDTVDKRSQYPG